MLIGAETNEEFEREHKRAKKAYSELSFNILFLFPKLFVLKSAAFREEREWRLISHLICNGKDSCSYRAMQDRLIPYRSFQLKQAERPPIAEVILGPKHLTPAGVVTNFLEQNGYGKITVKKSEATYR